MRVNRGLKNGNTVLFYAALLVASIILAVILLWLYRAISGIGTAIYQAILPSSKGNTQQKYPLTGHIKTQTTVNNASTPWGWGGNNGPASPKRATTAPTAASPAWTSSNRETHQNGGGYTPTGSPFGSAQDTGSNSAAGMAKPVAQGLRMKSATLSGWPFSDEHVSFASNDLGSQNKESADRRDQIRRNLRKAECKPWGW